MNHSVSFDNGSGNSAVTTWVHYIHGNQSLLYKPFTDYSSALRAFPIFEIETLN